MCADKVSFTEQRVARFPAPAKGYSLQWDDDAPGLGLRVTASGARSYVFEKRVHGETVRVTIGAAGPAATAWKLADARKRARELTVLVDKGGDPRVVAAEQRQEHERRRTEAERQDLLVRAAWDAYVAANEGNWGERHREDHIALAHAGGERRKKHGGKGLTKPGPLATLMPLKLPELTADCIAQWLKREAARRPTSAAQAFRLLRAFVNWTHDVAEYKGIVAVDACTARIVRELVPESRAKEGDCLQREQLPAWFRQVRRMPNRVIAAYLQGLLLLGPRREELAELQWSDVDFTWGSVVLRDKVEGERTIPLPPYLASVLSALPRKNRWVFYSEEADSGHIEEPTRAHAAALKAAALPHVTLHGLRRSFGTLAEWVEIPTGIVAQIQGHKPSAIAEKHYRRRPIDLLRVWHEKLEAWMLEQAGVPFTKPGDKAKLGVVKGDGTVQPAA